MEEAKPANLAVIGETGPIPKPRVHSAEWLVGLGGVVVLVGLLLPWAGGESSFESLSLLKLLVIASGLAALALPVIVASSSKTDLPVVWETFLSIFASLLLVPLAVRLIWPPSGGLEQGFFVVAAGCLLLAAAGWASVSREY